MKKFIAIPAIAILAVVGLAACDTDTTTTATEPTTQSAPKAKPPVKTSPVDGLTVGQWDIVEQYGTEAGLSVSETEAIAEDVVAAFESDLETTCDAYYTLGDTGTQEVLIDAAYETYGPVDSIVAGGVAYAVILNNC